MYQSDSKLNTLKKATVERNWSKGKIVLAHAMNTYRWSRSTIALTLSRH